MKDGVREDRMEGGGHQVKIKEILVKEFGGERLKECLQCGVCVGDCPISRVVADRFNPRRIVKKLLLDFKDVLFSNEVWLCAFCYTCQDRCPMKVKFPEILLHTRIMAAENGYLPSNPVLMVKTMLTKGRPIEVTEGVNELRESYGLERLEETVPRDVLDEVRKISEVTGLRRRLKME